MRAPKDQGLFFAVFVAVVLVVTLSLWIAMPVHQVVELEGEEEEAEESEVLILPPAATPEERIKKMETALGMARAVISQLEETEADTSKP